jgi:hypothetical protein
MGVGLANEAGQPGARDEDVAELFDVVRHDPPSWTEREMTLSGETIEVYAREAGEPAIFRKDHDGGGRAYFLNFVAPRSNAMLQWLEAEAIAGLPKIAEMSHLPGAPGEYELVQMDSGLISLLGVLRERRVALSEGPLTLTLPREAEVYDVRGREYMGKTDTIAADLAPGETALYALLPYRVQAIAVAAADVSLGERCTVGATIGSTAPTPGDHVVRFEVRDPSGALSEAYTRTVISRRGEAELTIPFALNDQPGEWRITARDVATGVEGEATVRVVTR